MTRILLAQNNPIIGDFENNANQIEKSIDFASQNHCQLVVTSELALCGYPPKDLLYYPSFLAGQKKVLNRLKEKVQNLTLIVGGIRFNEGEGKPLYNSCYIIQNGKIIDHYDKWLLPTYDVFNERRYFQPGTSPKIIDVNGTKIAITICEDIWHGEIQSLYRLDPLSEIASLKPGLLVNLSASPFELHKLHKRIELCQSVSSKLNCPVLYCNQIGGQDSLIFDGYSLAVDSKHILGIAKGFEEDHLIFDTDQISPRAPASYLDPQQLYNALVLGIRDYFRKQGFKQALLGLSGGIDSALVATLAAHALGKENVLAVSMPSRFSSSHSVEDAQKLSKNLQIELIEVPIESVHHTYLELFKKPFKGLKEDITEENIQSRIRGMILMAFSNKFKRLVLSCGNKSEMAMGYATLYGDLAGGLAVISDLTKTQVYEVSRWINHNKEVIPQSIVEKPPSAELRPNQRDSDSLPDYVILDQVIQGYVEKHLDASQIADQYQIEHALVGEIISKIHQNEYKRRQTPTGLKVTQKAFSMGWQFPIVHHHHPL